MHSEQVKLEGESQFGYSVCIGRSIGGHQSIGVKGTGPLTISHPPAISPPTQQSHESSWESEGNVETDGGDCHWRDREISAWKHFPKYTGLDVANILMAVDVLIMKRQSTGGEHPCMALLKQSSTCLSLKPARNLITSVLKRGSPPFTLLSMIN